ncbi:MAG: N-acetylornithine carbamoyltransferase [Bdellovibrionales bacterium]|nr:N-acetylornithine carbamoyltransferase [Bdellovibrionales bacterium]
MKQFTRAKSLSGEFIADLIERAHAFKKSKKYPNLSGKILGNVFFNPSLRTKLSFEAAMARSGGTALSLSSGSGTWAFESELGVRMDQDKPEHLKEAVRVMSRYVDALGVRSFASLGSVEEDAKEKVLSAFEEYATVPVVSLESAFEHPCQMLADMMTVQELVGVPRGKNFCLRWAPHIKALPLAVPHSALLAAAHLGMNITLAAPEGYDIDKGYENWVRSISHEKGATFTRITEPERLPEDTNIVYVKSWGAPSLYSTPARQQEELRKLSTWMVREQQLQRDSYLMHCLPVRRNVVVSDGALDHRNSKVIDQAENRLWAQLGVLDWIFSEE